MLKKYFKYIRKDCKFNKNLPSEIHHFGTIKYDETDDLYDLNNNIIKYNFHSIIIDLDKNIIDIEKTVGYIKNKFDEIITNCEYKNMIVYFNYINTYNDFMDKIYKSINELLNDNYINDTLKNITIVNQMLFLENYLINFNDGKTFKKIINYFDIGYYKKINSTLNQYLHIIN